MKSLLRTRSIGKPQRIEGVVIDKTFVEILEKAAEITGLNLQEFNSIRSKIAKAIYNYLPSVKSSMGWWEDCGCSGWQAVLKKAKGCRGSSSVFRDGMAPEGRNRYAASLF